MSAPCPREVRLSLHELALSNPLACSTCLLLQCLCRTSNATRPLHVHGHVRYCRIELYRGMQLLNRFSFKWVGTAVHAPHRVNSNDFGDEIIKSHMCSHHPKRCDAVSPLDTVTLTTMINPFRYRLPKAFTLTPSTGQCLHLFHSTEVKEYLDLDFYSSYD